MKKNASNGGNDTDCIDDAFDIDDNMADVRRSTEALMSSCFRESLSVDCGPRHRIRVVTDWASSSSSRVDDDDDDDGRRAEGSCSVDRRHCVVVAAKHADLARQLCVGRRSCDGLRVTSRPCPRLRPVDYQLLVFICVPGGRSLLILMPTSGYRAMGHFQCLAPAFRHLICPKNVGW